MISQKYKYIKLSQLISSVALDLNQYSIANYIKEENLIKVVHKCNDKLGVRIHKSKQKLIDVKNYSAELPLDFWKLELAFATYLEEIPDSSPLIPGNIVEYTTNPFTVPGGTIINNPKYSYKDSCGNCFWAVKYPTVENVKVITKMIPLRLGVKIKPECTEYCPEDNKVGQFSIDLDDNRIITSFKEGQIFISYLGALEDEETGELLIPFHPLLNDYYEYSIKEKILEDVFLNSEDDVEKKLQYISMKKKDAYLEAWQFTALPEYKEMENIYKRKAQKFYNKWYNIYNV